MRMKKVLFLISIFILSIEGWSQTVSILKTDGQIVNFNMADIKYIELSDENGGVVGNASIVGVWECTNIDLDAEHPETIKDVKMRIGERVYFKSDGTYSTDDETGRWTVKGNKLIIDGVVRLGDSSGVSIPFEYTITKLTSRELEFTLDLGFVKATYRFKRVS